MTRLRTQWTFLQGCTSWTNASWWNGHPHQPIENNGNLSPVSTWCPKPQGDGDFSLIEFASCIFTTTELNMINCYHIYLQVITLYDLILYDISAIHPEIEQALRVKSRQRAIFWVNFPNPPKSTNPYGRHSSRTTSNPSGWRLMHYGTQIQQPHAIQHSPYPVSLPQYIPVTRTHQIQKDTFHDSPITYYHW